VAREFHSVASRSRWPRSAVNANILLKRNAEGCGHEHRRAQQHEQNTRRELRVRPQSNANTTANGETNRSDRKSLNRDVDEGWANPRGKDAKRKANRKLVEADGKSECGEILRVSDALNAGFVLLFTSFSNFPRSEREEQDARRVGHDFSKATDDRFADEQSDDRHASFEEREREPDPHPVSSRGALHAKPQRDREGVEAEREKETNRGNHLARRERRLEVRAVGR